jgi:hypothetical protein
MTTAACLIEIQMWREDRACKIHEPVGFQNYKFLFLKWLSKKFFLAECTNFLVGLYREAEL